MSDGNTITYIGSDNQYYNQFAVVIPKVAYRALSAPLLGGETYRLTFIPPSWNPSFYPQTVVLDMNDRGACFPCLDDEKILVFTCLEGS